MEWAITYTRLIDELQHRARKVLDDKSGGYSQRWLEGKQSDKGAKLTGQDFWELLSGPVHANVRAIFDWVAISGEGGDHKIVVGPERRLVGANATLVFMAGAARDIGVLLAAHCRLGIDVSQHDQAIAARQNTYMPENRMS